MAKSDLGFARNYANALEINIAPEEEEPTWAVFSRGITSIVPSANESTEDKDYYDGYGTPTTKVTSTQIQYEIEGDRCYGDAAQDFVSSVALETGEGRDPVPAHRGRRRRRGPVHAAQPRPQLGTGRGVRPRRVRLHRRHRRGAPSSPPRGSSSCREGRGDRGLRRGSARRRSRGRRHARRGEPEVLLHVRRPVHRGGRQRRQRQGRQGRQLRDHGPLRVQAVRDGQGRGHGLRGLRPRANAAE